MKVMSKGKKWGRGSYYLQIANNCNTMQYMDDFIPNPANYTMKGNPPTSAPQKEPAAEIDINDPVALRALAKGALVEIVQKAPRNISLVGAIRELLDRVDGKAPQSIAMTVEDKGLGKLSTERLLALDRELCARAGVEPMQVRPMPGKLEMDD